MKHIKKFNQNLNEGFEKIETLNKVPEEFKKKADLIIGLIKLDKNLLDLALNSVDDNGFDEDYEYTQTKSWSDFSNAMRRNFPLIDFKAGMDLPILGRTGEGSGREYTLLSYIVRKLKDLL